MSAGKIVLGMLAGMAIGSVLGILFAPDKGSVTRKKLAKKGSDISRDAEDQVNGLMDKMSKKFQPIDSLDRQKVKAD